MKRKRIIVMGFMASCPIAGVIWQHIHYIVGLQRLGHDVFYIEDSARFLYDPEANEDTTDYSYAARLLQRLGAEFGFERHWAFCARFLPATPTVGLSLKRMRELYREADAILNVCGAQEFNEDLLESERLLYIDSDPGVDQIEVDLRRRGTINMLRRHRALFTFGENVGTSEFPVPTRGFKWWPTRQPVVIDFWKTNRPPRPGALLTTVANLNTAGKKDIEWRGENYLWNKSAELLRFLAAPRRAGETFELTARLDDRQLAGRLVRNGWQLRAVEAVSGDHRRYRDYIRGSKGEFTVAKDQYVRLNAGWFSDRSACYLAAGRPVITQDTGFAKHFGSEGGVFPFHSLGEIVEAVRMINADYAHHSRAARSLAREVFAAEKVLSALLERAGI